MKMIRIIHTLMILSIFTSCVVNVNAQQPTNQSQISVVGNPDDVKADTGFFSLQKLKYKYDALEPQIDARTMEIHYSKHYLGYTNKLNKAIAESGVNPETIEKLLQNLDMNNSALRNNAGGYYNHNLFWDNLSSTKNTSPKGEIEKAIIRDFGSVVNFKIKLSEVGAKQFGSGWAWLVTDANGKLTVGGTPNQDNPLMPKMNISGMPILALDVWEHAYYLKYQNKRADYVKGFWSIVDWNFVQKQF